MAMSTTRRWLVVCWGAFALDCGAKATANVSPSSPSALPASALVNAGAGARPVETAAPAPALPVNEVSGAAKPFEPAPPFAATLRLRLPSDPALVGRGIPPVAASRYATWGQVGMSGVGKGYLYFLEPFNEERWLLVKSADEGAVRIYDVATRRQLFMWSVNGLASDEEHVVLPWHGAAAPAVVVGKSDGLWLHKADSGEVLAHLSEFPVHRARWSPDGRILMTVESEVPAQTSRFRFFERRDAGLHSLGELPLSERVDGWALSPDNRFLARLYYPSDRVTLTDLHTGEVLLDVPSPQYAASVEFSPNGRFLAIAGAGVKVVDLSDPTRRAEYTYFENNVADIEFSPSGDVFAAPAYDGKLRLFSYEPQTNRIHLVRTFEHQKNTNVYAARFLKNGNSLVSSSGDRTVRYWGGKKAAEPSSSDQTWASPLQWLESGKHQTNVLATPTPRLSELEHHVPARLLGPAAPSRLLPGKYACKITLLYRLRGCTVEVDERGHTFLEFDEDNLLGVRGVLFDDGPVVRFEGWLTAPGSLGCASCAHQPIHAVLRGGGGKWEGLLLYKGHYDPLVPVEPPPPNAKFEEAIDRLPFVLLKQN